MKFQSILPQLLLCDVLTGGDGTAAAQLLMKWLSHRAVKAPAFMGHIAANN